MNAEDDRPMNSTSAAAWLGVSAEVLREWTIAGLVGFVDLRVEPNAEIPSNCFYTLTDLRRFVKNRSRIQSRGKAKPRPPSELMRAFQ